MADLMNTLLGIAEGSALAELRTQRPEVLRHTQGSHDVLLCPEDPGGLSLAERALVAQRVAALSGHAALATYYQGLVEARGVVAPARREALLAHASLLATSPGRATPDNLTALRAVGLSERDMVALSQLIAFVSYQVRAAVGLALLAREKVA